MQETNKIMEIMKMMSQNFALQQVVLHAQCTAGHADWTEIKFIHIYVCMQSAGVI